MLSILIQLYDQYGEGMKKPTKAFTFEILFPIFMMRKDRNFTMGIINQQISFYGWQVHKNTNFLVL